MDKKKWEKPVLVVVMKGRPEEGVLQACKVQIQRTGWTTDDYGCMDYNPCCDSCYETSGS